MLSRLIQRRSMMPLVQMRQFAASDYADISSLVERQKAAASEVEQKARDNINKSIDKSWKAKIDPSWSVKEQQASRAPSQGEIRFVENIQYDSEEEDIVPEIYREHRHRFSE